MLKWFKKQPENFPAYWNRYVTSFEEKPPLNIRDVSFVVLDTETTGFSYKEDRILSIGAVTVKNFSIDISSAFEYYLEQDTFNPETVKIHGILKNEDIPKISEEKAIIKFLDYIGNSVLVAHHANFDINMINYALKRLQLPKLKNEVLDTGVLYRNSRIVSNLIDRNKNYSLDELAETFSIDIKDRHTASGDAFITAIAFLKILGKLEKQQSLTYKELLKF